MIKSIFVFFFFLGFSTSLLAQAEPEALFFRKEVDIDIQLNSKDLDIKETYKADKAFYRNFEKHSREAVYYSDFDQILSLDAATLLPDKASSKKIKVSTIETIDIVTPGVFYGGYKRKDFVFPQLTAGAVGRLEYSKKITDSHLLTPYYFDEDVDVRYSGYSVTFPKSVKLHYKVFGRLKDKVTFKEKTSGDKIQYSWVLTDVPAYAVEENAPGRSFSATHVVIYIDSYELKGKQYKVLGNVSDLYQWYTSLVKTIPVEDETALKEIVHQLTNNLPTDEEKIRVIFQWVQKNIKYIAFEDGMAGFVPRAAADVYEKRYGDCKDMANLLKRMINTAGIDAYLTWIGTRRKPYTYDDVPTAITDDHMICSVRLNGSYVFLDATNSYLEFGKPSSMIQGKEALIGLSDQKFEVIKVPVIDYRQNQRLDSIQIGITKSGVEGRLVSSLKGYKKDDIEIKHLRAAINSDREYIRDFFDIGNDDIAIDKIVLTGLGDQNASAKATFTFKQPGYYKSIGDKIYVNINMMKALPGEKIDPAKRIQLLENDYAYENKSITVFTIPEGYALSFMPTSTDRKWDHFAISSTYRAEGNQVVQEKTLCTSYLYLGHDKFEQWNEFVQAVSDINLQTVILKKK